MTDPQLEERLRAWFKPLAQEAAPATLRARAAEIPRDYRRGRWFGFSPRRMALAFAVIAVSAAVVGGALTAGGTPSTPHRSLAAVVPPTIQSPPAPSPQVGPSNGEIAFSAGGHVVIVNPDGTNRRELGLDGWSAYDPAWSPDGSTIAFLGLPCSASQACHTSLVKVQGGSVGLMNSDGSGMSIVASGVGWPGAFAWRPDGTLEVASGKIVKAAYGSRPVRIVTGRPGVWSPDEAFFAYRDGAGVHVLDVKGRTDTLVVADSTAVPVQWLADDSGLAFVVDRPHDAADAGSWIVDPSGGDRRPVPHVTAHALFAGWAPGGRLLAFVEREGNVQAPTRTIVIARADGTLKWGAPSLPTWSPDGTRALFVSEGGLSILLEPVTDLTVPLPPIEIPGSNVLGASWQALP